MRPKKKVLLIAQDEVALSVLRFVLCAHGFAVKAATSEVDALKTARIWQPDVVIGIWPENRELKLAALLVKLGKAAPNVSTLVLAGQVEHPELADPKLLADAMLGKGQCAMEQVIERTKILAKRKHGPRKGWKLPPARVGAAAAKGAAA